MTEEERFFVRTAYRPFMDALMGRQSSVTQEEWAAAVDRVFPPSAVAVAASDSDVAGENVETAGRLRKAIARAKLIREDIPSHSATGRLDREALTVVIAAAEETKS